ncbi:MAG: hypothetical protein WBB05_25190 [Mycolicibacterium fortuitum]
MILIVGATVANTRHISSPNDDPDTHIRPASNGIQVHPTTHAGA